jgi:hypothetical protein
VLAFAILVAIGVSASGWALLGHRLGRTSEVQEPASFR